MVEVTVDVAKLLQDYTDLQREFNSAITRENNISPRIVKVNKKTLLAELESAQKEVEEQHKKAMLVWRRAFNIFSKHIASNPGSQQIRNPGEMPKYPKQYDVIKSNIRMIKPIYGPDTITLELDFLKGLFKTVEEAVADARWSTANYVSMASGATVNWNR